VALSDLTEKKI